MSAGWGVLGAAVGGLAGAVLGAAVTAVVGHRYVRQITREHVAAERARCIEVVEAQRYPLYDHLPPGAVATRNAYNVAIDDVVMQLRARAFAAAADEPRVGR